MLLLVATRLLKLRRACCKTVFKVSSCLCERRYYTDGQKQQAAQLKDTETAMQGISLAVETVQSALQRAKALIMEPYAQLQLKTQQLRNLHSTVEILRHVIQRLKLVAKLKQQIDTKSGGYQDLAKAAKLLADIDTIGSEADLAGLDVIEADSEFLHSTWRDVQGQAEARILLLLLLYAA